MRAFSSSLDHFSFTLPVASFILNRIGSRIPLAVPFDAIDSRIETLFCSRCGVCMVGEPLGRLETAFLGVFSLGSLLAQSSSSSRSSILLVTCARMVIIKISRNFITKPYGVYRPDEHFIGCSLNWYVCFVFSATK